MVNTKLKLEYIFESHFQDKTILKSKTLVFLSVSDNAENAVMLI